MKCLLGAMKVSFRVTNRETESEYCKLLERDVLAVLITD